ncbi:MAG: methyltransferase [Rubripirellula sp.]
MKRQAERLYLVFGGHIFFQTLNAAARLDLFTLLRKHNGLTRDQICHELNIQAQPARILLLGLVSSGMLKKRGDVYRNTRLTNELLCADSPTNILPYVALQHHVMYRGMPKFFESIKEYRNCGLEEFEGNEETLYQRLAHDPEVEEVFHDSMSALSVQTNKILADFLDLSDVQSLVDIGGGDGTNIITLTAKHPHLKGRVFDLPSVANLAREQLAAHPNASRLGAVNGNCFEDDLPTDADCFLLAHFCTIWSPEKNKQLLKKCFDALPSGGRVIIFNMMQNNDETGPLSAAVGSPYFLTIATGEGMLYTWNEYEQWAREVGFAEVSSEKLPRDHGAIVAIKR